MSNILTLTSVTKLLKGNAVLNNITFEVEELENLAVIGSTGSSKTTLLKAMSGLLDIDEGRLLFRGKKVMGPSRKLVPGHPHIKYLSQNFSLPKFIKVIDYLDRPNEVSISDPTELYNACHIEHLLSRDTMSLSGGERQRVAIAKEVLKAPSILLLDEPFSNLDYSHKQELHQLLHVLKNDLGVTTILVAHDPKDVMSWADTVLVMHKGNVAQSGPIKEVYNAPINEYVAGLLGVYTKVPASFFGVSESKNEVILRPHHIRLMNKRNAQRGVVQSIAFHGSYEEISFISKGYRFYAISEVGRFTINQEVYFEIDQ